MTATQVISTDVPINVDIDMAPATNELQMHLPWGPPRNEADACNVMSYLVICNLHHTRTRRSAIRNT